VDAIHPAPPLPTTSPSPLAPVTWRDLRATHTLEKVCFGRDAWGYLDLFMALVQPGIVRLKAQVDGNLAGMVIGESRPFEGVGWIASICVHPAYQRRGLGKALLAAAEAALPQSLIKLTVRKSNANAIALYQQFGYEQLSIWPNYYSGGEDGLVMEKSKVRDN
jgi:[ribosomal protein S18]-alanine N-acetyltransferase